MHVLTGMRKASKENEKDIENKAEKSAECNTRIETKLHYIGKDVKDIKYDIRTHEARMGSIEERVTRVEESAKSAHKRLDGIEREE